MERIVSEERGEETREEEKKIKAGPEGSALIHYCKECITWCCRDAGGGLRRGVRRGHRGHRARHGRP